MELASIVEEPSACASMAMAQVAGFLASSNYRVSPPAGPLEDRYVAPCALYVCRRAI
jgi:hypothetical protein